MNRIQGEAETRLFGIRQAGSVDCEAIRFFLAGLSPRTRYLRFFTGAPSTTAAALRLLAGGGGDTDVILATAAGSVIGHAMAVDSAGRHDGRVAEIGVAVTDAWQGRGVGSALTRALADRALARGATVLAMDVLPDNQRVLAMIAHHWPDACCDRSGDYVTVHASLSSVAPLPAAAPPVTIAPGGRAAAALATA